VCVDNNVDGHYVEPYAGGASVALYLLIEGKVDKITINDYDRSIYAFWHSVLNNTEKLCKMINDVEISIDTRSKMKEIQKNKRQASLLDLGFSTFFLNRVNRSGIIDAGVIGGIEQKGEYRMDCRFNKEELLKRIREIAKYKKNITLYKKDAAKLIDKISKESNNSNTILYFDPPYYLKGSSLYLNYYNDKQHAEIAAKIENIENMHWIVSYDNTDEIINMYKWSKNKFSFTLSHSAHKSKEGREILFASDTLKNIDYSLIKKPIRS